MGTFENRQKLWTIFSENVCAYTEKSFKELLDQRLEYLF